MDPMYTLVGDPLPLAVDVREALAAKLVAHRRIALDVLTREGRAGLAVGLVHLPPAPRGTFLPEKAIKLPRKALGGDGKSEGKSVCKYVSR